MLEGFCFAGFFFVLSVSYRTDKQQRKSTQTHAQGYNENKEENSIEKAQMENVQSVTT
jgi:hypothetical protein